MSKYNILISRMLLDGVKTFVLSASGVNESTLDIILKGYNLPGYEITISETGENPEGSEQARWLRGE